MARMRAQTKVPMLVLMAAVQDFLAKDHPVSIH